MQELHCSSPILPVAVATSGLVGRLQAPLFVFCAVPPAPAQTLSAADLSAPEAVAENFSFCNLIPYMQDTSPPCVQE